MTKVSGMPSLFILLSITLLSCAESVPRFQNNSQPTVRVGIVENRERVVFRLDKDASLSHSTGGFSLPNAPEGEWNVEAVSVAGAVMEYRLSVGLEKTRYAAEGIVDYVAGKGFSASVRKVDLHIAKPLQYIHNATFQTLLTRKFSSKEEAISYQSQIRSRINTELAAIPTKKSVGKLKFTHVESGDTFEARGAVRIRTAGLRIADVDVGSGFHWERSEVRSYENLIEFFLDYSGKITVINELPLENYIKGVVPSEMSAGFPLEALKAQAVTARVESVAKIGLRHPHEPFDLCDDVHCQAFGGASSRSKSTDEAVAATRGIFMIYQNGLANAFYSGVCGGHTESNENVWNMDKLDYLRGRLDKFGRTLNSSLENEKAVKRWIDSKPDVHCNSFNRDAPGSIQYSKKYFRWNVEYKRLELEKIIQRNSGESFGSLIDLKPLKRGVSGRIVELEVVGSERRFKIGKELAIRKALSEKTLYSACFYVEKIGLKKTPDRFVLHGAGWGHGVGMCQVGAAVMARQGVKYEQILAHYYNGVRLRKLYL